MSIYGYGYRSDDPVKDAERYYMDLEEMEVDEQERDYIRCDICGEKIYREDYRNRGDEYWELDDQRICERCLEDYLSKARRTA